MYYFNIFKQGTEKASIKTGALQRKPLMTNSAKDTEWQSPSFWEVHSTRSHGWVTSYSTGLC